jgi:ribonuclease HI
MTQLSFLSPQPEISSSPPVAIHWKLYIDGASRKNPGPSGAGLYVEKNSKAYKKAGFYLGTRTNNQAEYGALLLGIYAMKKLMHSHDTLDIISDSQLLVRQFKGEYKVKHPELKPLHMIAKEMLSGTKYHIMHVLREFNTEADHMANVGIDEKKPLPPEFLLILKQHDITW